MKDRECHGCNEVFPDAMMADWSVCRSCMERDMEQYHEGPVYIDSLGIVWSQEELKEAGGQQEVDSLAREARLS